MPPKKTAAAHDDSKSETPHKEKNGHHHHHHHHPNGKAKRAANSVSKTSAASAKNNSGDTNGASTSSKADDAIQGLQWSSFERPILHSYRREYRLPTPTSFADPYHQIVLAQAGSVGLFSPSMARKKDLRRQSKDELATATRKHFNSLGIQESDIVAAVLHKVKNDGITKRRRRPEHMPLVVEADR